VDGDLLELDEATLAHMRGEIDALDQSVEEYAVTQRGYHIPEIAKLRNIKLHREKQEVQQALRSSIAWWAGFCNTRGLGDSETYRLFWFRFGTDILSAQALGSREALELAERINLEIGGWAQ
jgi:hypothetical protein